MPCSCLLMSMPIGLKGSASVRLVIERTVLVISEFEKLSILNFICHSVACKSLKYFCIPDLCKSTDQLRLYTDTEENFDNSMPNGSVASSADTPVSLQ